MARSKTIWIVVDSFNDDIVAAFTVKHELITYLTNCPEKEYLDIFKIPDGGYGPPEKFSG